MTSKPPIKTKMRWKFLRLWGRQIVSEKGITNMVDKQTQNDEQAFTEFWPCPTCDGAGEVAGITADGDTSYECEECDGDGWVPYAIYIRWFPDYVRQD